LTWNSLVVGIDPARILLVADADGHEFIVVTSHRICPAITMTPSL
jgi:hypothetical protein